MPKNISKTFQGNLNLEDLDKLNKMIVLALEKLTEGHTKEVYVSVEMTRDLKTLQRFVLDVEWEPNVS